LFWVWLGENKNPGAKKKQKGKERGGTRAKVRVSPEKTFKRWGRSLRDRSGEGALDFLGSRGTKVKSVSTLGRRVAPKIPDAGRVQKGNIKKSTQERIY